jgi:hyperosmotically inducible periplasmic protein
MQKLIVSSLAVCISLASLSACQREPSAPADPADKTVGNVVDDTVVSTRVRSALIANPYIKSGDIKVETFKGSVQLSGFAEDQSQIDQSVAVTKAVEGVTAVVNQLSIKEGKQTVGNKIDDAVITTAVKSALMADASVKSADISVTTRKGEVQLSGFVDSDAQSLQAIAVTKQVEGVTEVSNHLTVKK